MIDPYGEAAHRRRVVEKREQHAAELRGGVNTAATIEAAASEWLTKMEQGRPDKTADSSVDVDTSDLDPDLYSAAEIAVQHQQRLTSAISANMEAGWPSVLASLSPELRADIAPNWQPDRDLQAILAEVDAVVDTPSEPESSPLEDAAAEWLGRFNAPKRSRRR